MASIVTYQQKVAFFVEQTGTDAEVAEYFMNEAHSDVNQALLMFLQTTDSLRQDDGIDLDLKSMEIRKVAPIVVDTEDEEEAEGGNPDMDVIETVSSDMAEAKNGDHNTSSAMIKEVLEVEAGGSNLKKQSADDDASGMDEQGPEVKALIMAKQQKAIESMILYSQLTKKQPLHTYFTDGNENNQLRLKMFEDAFKKRQTNKGIDGNAFSEFSMVSWNVNGLDDDEKLVSYRMFAAIKEIDGMMPEVVFMQEVIARQAAVIKHCYEDMYDIHYQNKELDGYFTIVLVSKKLKVLKAKTVPFRSSIYSRAMQIVLVNAGNNKMALINSHLESCKESAEERVRQLKECVSMSDKYEKRGYHVIFGGDLNMRNIEAKSNIDEKKDCFVMAGEPKNFKNTWIMPRTEGQTFEDRIKQNMVRARFDRIYSFGKLLKFGSFKLFGLKKLVERDVDISDHLGLHITFNYDSTSKSELDWSGDEDEMITPNAVIVQKMSIDNNAEEIVPKVELVLPNTVITEDVDIKKKHGEEMVTNVDIVDIKSGEEMIQKVEIVNIENKTDGEIVQKPILGHLEENNVFNVDEEIIFRKRKLPQISNEPTEENESEEESAGKKMKPLTNNH